MIHGGGVAEVGAEDFPVGDQIDRDVGIGQEVDRHGGGEGAGDFPGAVATEHRHRGEDEERGVGGEDHSHGRAGEDAAARAAERLAVST